MNAATVRSLICEAFRDEAFPGVDRIVGSLSDEAIAVRRAFACQVDWQSIDSILLDTAPEGLGSALNHFAPEAFKFYLPAYLLADLHGLLSFSEPDFSLCYAFSTAWQNHVGRTPDSDKYAVFDTEQCKAICAYLEWKYEITHDDMIRKALDAYWLPRCITAASENNPG